VYLAVGSITLMFSAMSDRRGRAIGVVFGLLVFSFLVNFLSQPLPVMTEESEVGAKVAAIKEDAEVDEQPIWEPAKSVAFLSVMEYYRPAFIIESQEFPKRNISILLIVSIICWTIGGVIFRRRSICTV
ncbi:MAG: hypothetical protein AB8G99_02435, partial [Planctomycetaceae bacterium]